VTNFACKHTSQCRPSVVREYDYQLYRGQEEKKEHALPIGRINNAAVAGRKEDIEVREVKGDGAASRSVTFFVAPIQAVSRFRMGLLGVGRASNVHCKTRDPNARRH